MVDQFHVPFTASDSQVGFNPSLHYPDAWHALASSVHRVSPLAALGVCLFWSKMTLPRPSVASSSICIHLWRHLFTGVGAELRPTAAVLPQFVQPFWLRPGGLFRRCLDQSPVCCAWPWNHGVRLRGVRLARSLASLCGLLRGLALSARGVRCLGVHGTPLGSSLKARFLVLQGFYLSKPKRSASRPRGRVSLVKDDVDASVPAPTATAALGSPSEGRLTEVASADAPCSASDSVATSLAPTDRLVSSSLTSSVQATSVITDIPHDPMVHTDTSNLTKEAVEDAPWIRRILRRLLIGWLPRMSRITLWPIVMTLFKTLSLRKRS
ncbi:hypothetical protein V6N11_066702 [Hibiscus sabdariffa]|uniref:Uncharacterized protein n=1 Tax=Hibiscus sabdariffa TaxID=183260 RepID=A0ABR1ZXW1_9ROSI